MLNVQTKKKNIKKSLSNLWWNEQAGYKYFSILSPFWWTKETEKKWKTIIIKICHCSLLRWYFGVGGSVSYC